MDTLTVGGFQALRIARPFPSPVGITRVMQILLRLSRLLLRWISRTPPVLPAVGADPTQDRPIVVAVGGVVTFATWLSLRRHLVTLLIDQDVIVDLAATCLVDHTIMEKLHDLEKEFASRGRHLTVLGSIEPWTSSPPGR